MNYQYLRASLTIETLLLVAN